MKCEIQVIGKRVLAKSIPKESKEKKVIIVPEDKKLEEIFEVIAINEETPKNIKVGSRVIVKSNWVSKFNHNGMDICVLSHEEIIGVINEKA